MKRLLALIFSLSTIASTLYAVRTDQFTDSTYFDFSLGKATGITISEDGMLQLGPQMEKYCDIPTSIVWTMVRDGKDNLYVAAGNQGQIFKIKKGQALEFFKAEELQIQALTTDPKGNLYAGSIPDGKVYKIDPEGKSSVFFDPHERYIWALQFDQSGNLFVATGENGKLFKVDPQGNGTVFYDSTEAHLRTLLLDSKKRLWVGGEENGLVYRFDQIDGTEGRPFIAYDSSLREIKSICEAPDGTIFVAAMGERDHPISLIKPNVPKTSQVNSASHDNEPKAPTLNSNQSDSEPGLGEIIHLLPDGTAERWWSDAEDVYAIGAWPNGHIWAGTNRKGTILELTGPKQGRILGQLDAETVTALVPSEEGRWFATTSNVGAVWKISYDAGRSGTFESRIFDTRGPSRWGRLSFHQPEKGIDCRFFTRSGNTNKPDKAWSDWTPIDQEQKIKSPVARYIQYKVELQATSSESGKEPSLDGVSIYYQTKNLSPTIARLTIHSPHLELVRISKDTGSAGSSATSSSNAVKPNSAESANDGNATRISGIQQNKKLGWRSATWLSTDPNGDDLIYKISYRAAGSTDWKLLKDDVRDTLIAWDASTWKDGEYYLKIEASDELKNNEGDERMDEIVSSAFTVDHQAPRIDYDVENAKNGNIKLKVSDTTSVVDEVQYCVDGNRWKPLLPISGIYDSSTNDFQISTSDLSNGSHYINVRASDSSDNISTVTINLKK